jgi:hypothetical protein
MSAICVCNFCRAKLPLTTEGLFTVKIERSSGSYEVVWASCPSCQQNVAVGAGNKSGSTYLFLEMQGDKFYVTSTTQAIRLPADRVKKSRHKLGHLYVADRVTLWVVGYDGFLWWGWAPARHNAVIHLHRTKKRAKVRAGGLWVVDPRPPERRAAPCR